MVQDCLLVVLVSGSIVGAMPEDMMKFGVNEDLVHIMIEYTVYCTMWCTLIVYVL